MPATFSGGCADVARSAEESRKDAYDIHRSYLPSTSSQGVPSLEEKRDVFTGNSGGVILMISLSKSKAHQPSAKSVTYSKFKIVRKRSHGSSRYYLLH